MARILVALVVATLSVVLIAGAQPAGKLLAESDLSHIRGSCTVSYSNCADRVDKGEGCNKCLSGTAYDCDTPQQKYGCDIIHTGHTCIACGTCQETCPGNKRQFRHTGCTGTFSTVGACAYLYDFGATQTCQQYCP